MTAATRSEVATNPYLAEYRARLAHQREHDRDQLYQGQPNPYCMGCLRAGSGDTARETRHDIKRRFSWAIPNDAALDAIAAHSPGGVVEIGAGGGYWAGMLRSRGVDVVAYDPDPEGGDWTDDGQRGWHDGTRWSDVLPGDHTAVTRHPDRTLLLVWPSYGGEWTDQVIDLYAGDTVIYVGEGSGGCTGTDRMHVLLGEEPYCWHDDGDEDCDCPKGVAPKFRSVTEVEIPSWWGIHDRLYVFARVAEKR